MDSYLQSLVATNPLQEPIFRRAIHALDLPSGSRGIDVGCGIGLQAIMLTEAVGPAGHVTGIDLSPEFLDCARDIAEKAGMSEQVSFQEGDMNNLPFDDATFDWVWSANCAGYAPVEPLPLLKELARVVKPGGSVIIIVWSSQQLLPGFPLLEAHLNATSSGIAPFARGTAPELHFPRMVGWFRRAGMEEVTVRTFAGDVCAPLSGEMQSALTALIEMRWVDVGAEFQKGTGLSFSGCVCLSHRILFWILRITTRSIRIRCFRGGSSGERFGGMWEPLTGLDGHGGLWRRSRIPCSG